MFLVTSSPEFESAARAELVRLDPKLEVGDTLAPGLFLVSPRLDEEAFSAFVAANQPIYVRHLFPVQTQIELTDTPQDLEQLALKAAEQASAKNLPDGAQFSVQARFAEGSTYSYSPFAIKEAIAAALTSANQLQENIKAPEYIISVVCAENTAYLGLSTPDQNLSGWAGGMRHYAKRPEQISRAELKLLEALEVFDLTLPTNGTALDLGAAPGGWSRVLLEAGLRVVAVDPAALDPRLYIPGLEHYRGHAETFLREAKAENRRFAVICNDMRMDALVAAQIMTDFAPLLAPSGFAITSLKLPFETKKVKPAALVSRALALLQTTYSEVRARQLFHNRQEITVLVRK